MPARVRYEVPRLLRYIGTARAAEVLLKEEIPGLSVPLTGAIDLVMDPANPVRPVDNQAITQVQRWVMTARVVMNLDEFITRE